MSQRKVRKVVTGKNAVDGAGVKLVRVIGSKDTQDFDPFLMLDCFDSTNPEDYIKGFPRHPHRGIETITYLIEGRIDHKDSLGNSGSILSGEVQWMTAGSGIMHEEMPKASERMLGLQVWLNLPAADKMCEPAYFAIDRGMIAQYADEECKVNIISGSFKDVKGATPPNVKARLLDVLVNKGCTVNIDTDSTSCVFLFLIENGANVCGDAIAEKSAVLTTAGNSISVKADKESSSRFILFEGPPLGESIAWGGPIVMNTRQELQNAFDELNNGTFIKHRI